VTTGTEEKTERVWLVERSVDDRDLVTLIYATPDGARVIRRQVSAAHLSKADVTAATTVKGDRLTPSEDPATRERYALEVDRIRAEHDPEDQV
jgi:hypothetical protein